MTDTNTNRAALRLATALTLCAFIGTVNAEATLDELVVTADIDGSMDAQRIVIAECQAMMADLMSADPGVVQIDAQFHPLVMVSFHFAVIEQPMDLPVVEFRYSDVPWPAGQWDLSNTSIRLAQLDVWHMQDYMPNSLRSSVGQQQGDCAELLTLLPPAGILPVFPLGGAGLLASIGVPRHPPQAASRSTLNIT